MTKTYGPNKLTIDQMHSKAKDAGSAGHSHYFTGKLCKNGHIAPRRTKGYGCLQCDLLKHSKSDAKRKPYKEYYQKNRERILLKARQYREENRDVVKQKQKNYYQANIERERKRDRERYNKNREENIERVISYYQENKEKILQKRREYRRKNKEKIREQRRAYYLRLQKKQQEYRQKKRKQDDEPLTGIHKDRNLQLEV